MSRPPRAGRASILLLLAALATGCSGAAGAQPSPSPSGDDICGGAPPRSQVVVYSAPGLEFWYSTVLRTFALDCAVHVYYVGASSQEIVRRLAGERSGPLGDIVVAQPPYISSAADEGLLDSGGVPMAGSVPPDRCDKRRRWCTVAETYASWIYSPSKLSTPPRTWDELLVPPLRGAVVDSPPDQAVDGLAMVELLVQEMGKDAAFAYLQQLEAGTKAHFTLTDTMSRVVTAGEALVANGNLQEHLNDLVQYRGIAPWFPAAPKGLPTTLALPYGAALVRNGPNHAAAQALLTLMWSKAAQNYLGDAFAAPARPDVSPKDSRSTQITRALKGVRVLRIDWEPVALETSDLVQRWLAIQRAPTGTPPSLVPAAPSPPAPAPAPSP